MEAQVPTQSPTTWASITQRHVLAHKHAPEGVGKIKTTMQLILLVLTTIKLYGQQPVSASFVATLVLCNLSYWNIGWYYSRSGKVHAQD